MKFNVIVKDVETTTTEYEIETEDPAVIEILRNGNGDRAREVTEKIGTVVDRDEFPEREIEVHES